MVFLTVLSLRWTLPRPPTYEGTGLDRCFRSHWSSGAGPMWEARTL